MMEKVPMTASGYAALEVELKQRQSVDRPRIIEHIAEARSHGDLSENAEYHAAKEEQSHNEGRIAELEDKLARADIIDISKLSGDTIKFGATVTLVDEDTEKKAVWQIVGEAEADAKKGRISITSPLARALIGKKKGATVEVWRRAAPRPTRSPRSSGDSHLRVTDLQKSRVATRLFCCARLALRALTRIVSGGAAGIHHTERQ